MVLYTNGQKVVYRSMNLMLVSNKMTTECAFLTMMQKLSFYPKCHLLPVSWKCTTHILTVAHSHSCSRRVLSKSQVPSLSTLPCVTRCSKPFHIGLKWSSDKGSSFGLSGIANRIVSILSMAISWLTENTNDTSTELTN